MILLSVVPTRSKAGPAFAALFNRIDGNGVRVVLVEDATRFARDLMARELGIGVLIKLGMRVITATGDDLTETDDHMKVAMRQIAGAFSQLEKARLVAKLKAARDRKLAETGKCGGRKSYAERNPERSRWRSSSMLRGYRIGRSVQSLPSLATSRGRPYRRPNTGGLHQIQFGIFALFCSKTS